MNERAKDRERERAYWDAHGIDEEPGEEVEVRVKKPLSVMLSLRLDEEHAEKLKALAEKEERGITTVARRLLQWALDSQFLAQAMSQRDVQSALNELFEGSKVPPGAGEPTHYILSTAELSHVSALILKAWGQAMQEAVASARTVTPEQLRELEKAGHS